MDTIFLSQECVRMPRTRNPYPAEFREQLVSLALAGRSVEGLAREFEPCVATAHEWIKQAEGDGSRPDERRVRRALPSSLREPSAAPGPRYPGIDRGLACSERRDVVSVYQMMTANQATFPISTMSTALDVSQYGFYASRARTPLATRLPTRHWLHGTRQSIRR